MVQTAAVAPAGARQGKSSGGCGSALWQSLGLVVIMGGVALTTTLAIPKLRQFHATHMKHGKLDPSKPGRVHTDYIPADREICAESRHMEGRAGPAKAAFCVVGHPRTFTQDAGYTNLRRAIENFGADAYMFFYLTENDPGTSKRVHMGKDIGNLEAGKDNVLRAMRALDALGDNYSYYGTPKDVWPKRVPNLNKNCSVPRKGTMMTILASVGAETNKLGRWWETWKKMQRCYAQVERYEQDHAMKFDWVVRVRPDLYFFDNPKGTHPNNATKTGLPAWCALDQDVISTPMGCAANAVRFANDHIAFCPRRRAEPYFNLVSSYDDCSGDFCAGIEMGPYMSCFGGDYGETYLSTYMKKTKVKMAKTAVAYTLLRKSGPACTRVSLFPVHSDLQTRILWRQGCMGYFCDPRPEVAQHLTRNSSGRFEVTVEHKTFRLECAANGNGTVIWDDSGGWLEGGRGGGQPPPITTKRRYLV